MSKRLRWVFLLVMVAMVLVACGGSDDDGANAQTTNDDELAYLNTLLGVVNEEVLVVPDITLASTSGDDFSFSDHEGEILLIYFGYLNCPDVCPLTMAHLNNLYREMDESMRARVQVVMITVDPERDTIDRLAVWMPAFNEDFMALRAEGETLSALMDHFDVVAVRNEETSSAMGYIIDHTASVFVVDPAGQWISRFLYNTSTTTMLHDIELILAHAELEPSAS